MLGRGTNCRRRGYASAVSSTYPKSWKLGFGRRCEARAWAWCARRAGGGAGRHARLPLREAQRVQGLGTARLRGVGCGAGWDTWCGARAPRPREGRAAARGRVYGGHLARRGASGPPRARRVRLRGGGAWCCCTRYGTQCGARALGRRPPVGGRHAWWRRRGTAWGMRSGPLLSWPPGRGSGRRPPTRTSEEARSWRHEGAP